MEWGSPLVGCWSARSASESRHILSEVLGTTDIIVAGFNHPLTGGGGVGTVMRSLEHHLPAFHLVSSNPGSPIHRSPTGRWIWPVGLTELETTGFHKVFLKQYVWPCLHGLSPSVSLLDIDAARPTFTKVNELFADAITKLAQRLSDLREPVIWFNDYALAWCISQVRERLGSQVRIGLSFRSSFGGSSPPRLLRQDIASLLHNSCSADFISFHRLRDLQHFFRLAEAATLNCDRANGTIESKLPCDLGRRHRTFIRAVPMGNDADALGMISSSDGTAAAMKKYRDLVGNVRVVAAISRLEHHKNILVELNLVSELLTQHPEFARTFSLIRLMPMPPEYSQLKPYSDLKKAIEDRANDINASFGSTSWRPIHLLSGRFYDRNEVVGLLRLAEVVIVASKADGFSHIPFETLLSKQEYDPDPVLLLTDVGATDYLAGAYLKMQTHLGDQAEQSLQKAFTLPANTKHLMFKKGLQQASELSTHQWL